MSASTVIGDVTETLQDLLKSEQQLEFAVTLESPAEETIDDLQPKVNLFLFRVAENPFAKNQEWQPVGMDTFRYPPLTLNLFYVVTPFAKAKKVEHQVLGEAMRILHENGIIPSSHLQGALQHTAEELKVALCQLSLEDLTRIWNALNKPYRLSVCYEVRIVMIDAGFEKPGRRVIESEMQFSVMS